MIKPPPDIRVWAFVRFCCLPKLTSNEAPGSAAGPVPKAGDANYMTRTRSNGSSRHDLLRSVMVSAGVGYALLGVVGTGRQDLPRIFVIDCDP